MTDYKMTDTAAASKFAGSTADTSARASDCGRLHTGEGAQAASKAKRTSFLERRPRRAILVFLALGLSLALFGTQCEPLGSLTAPLKLSSTELMAEVVPVILVNYQNCDSLLEQIQAEALERVGPYGLETDGPIWIEPLIEPRIEPAFAIDDAIAESAGEPVGGATLSSATARDTAASADSSAASPAPAAGDGASFSGTNVQVSGVDEADIVKTNGEVIIGISQAGRSLWVADVSSTTPELIGRVGLGDTYYQEMFLSGDRVFLIGNDYTGITPFGSGGAVGSSSGNTASSGSASSSGGAASSGSAGSPAPDIATSIAYPNSGEQIVKITEVDLSDPRDPEVSRHLRIEGHYISSRLTGGHMRVVISSSPNQKLGLIQPGFGGGRSEQIAERVNRELIRESTISQWLPEYSLNDDLGNLIDSGVLLGCNKTFIPQSFAGFNQVSVVSLPAQGPLQVRDATSVMAQGETVYASTDNLYVSHVVRDFDFTPRRPRDLTEETAIHKFALLPNGQANYEGSGAVVGRPLNQFAFHEHDGHLFVATTQFGANFEDSQSFVTSLQDHGDELAILDKVGNLGRGESIFAVRYVGDTAYVVTFRRTDPLYVVDLSDPTDLVTQGELKITGYSAYLHPVGSDLLLGVGQEATERGVTTGVKLSLFDVSDPTDPRALDDLVLEGGSSDVEWDHRAFLWWAPKSLAVVPVNNYRTGFYGAIAVRIRAAGDTHSLTLDEKISHEQEQDRTDCVPWPLGLEVPDESFELDQPADLDDSSTSSSASTSPEPTDLDQPVKDEWCDDYGQSAILRSLVVGDDLWTLSHDLLQANDLDSLDLRAWVRLPD